MLISVKDKSKFLPKSKLPQGFRQMGRVSSGSKSGLLLYEEDTGEFYGIFGSGLEKLDRPEILVLLGLEYIKYDPRVIAIERFKNSAPRRAFTAAERKKAIENSKRTRAKKALARMAKRQKIREQQMLRKAQKEMRTHDTGSS
jgi:hypothetical protein